MQTKTKSIVTHRTVVTSETKTGDGGKALLNELFDDVRGDRRVGRMIADFAVGGSIASLVFEETETIPQSQIEVAPAASVKQYD